MSIVADENSPVAVNPVHLQIAERLNLQLKPDAGYTATEIVAQLKNMSERVAQLSKATSRVANSRQRNTPSIKLLRSVRYKLGIGFPQ